MKLLARIKRSIASIVLRGRIMEWWLSRKSKVLEREYLAQLVDNSVNPPAPEQPPALNLSQPLKKLLFIGDMQWEQEELIPELKKIFEVDVLNLRSSVAEHIGRGTEKRAVESAVERFIKSGSAPEPDVIFFYARSLLLSDAAFDLLRRRWHCPIIGLNLDDKIEFLDYGVFSERNDNYQEWAKRFDLNITNVRATADWYSDRGLPVHYMAEGYHLKNPPPLDQPDFRYEMTFLGRKRYERELLVRQLQELNVPVEPLGFGWPGSGPVKNPDLVYRSSKLNLGIGFASPSLTLTTLKGRDFECPGAGACYLTTYNWELGLHYEIGKEILCYRSIEELVEIFSFYRRRPEACLKIAQAAYRRCAAEHTWEKRFRDMFRETGVLL